MYFARQEARRLSVVEVEQFRNARKVLGQVDHPCRFRCRPIYTVTKRAYARTSEAMLRMGGGWSGTMTRRARFLGSGAAFLSRTVRYAEMTGMIARCRRVRSCRVVPCDGDSTLAPRKETVKLGSWGDALKPHLAPGNGIVNRSVGGRTVRTTKPGWPKSLELISKGDFVIIQFGINDAAKKKLVEEEEFKKTIAGFADDVMAKGATPIICSPVANAGYGKNAKADAQFALTPSRRRYGDYAKAVAKEKNLAYVDMTALTAAELAKLGKDGALALYVGDTMNHDKPIFDTTHPAKSGTKRFAELFIADVKGRNLPVAKLFK